MLERVVGLDVRRHRRRRPTGRRRTSSRRTSSFGFEDAPASSWAAERDDGSFGHTFAGSKSAAWDLGGRRASSKARRSPRRRRSRRLPTSRQLFDDGSTPGDGLAPSVMIATSWNSSGSAASKIARQPPRRRGCAPSATHRGTPERRSTSRGGPRRIDEGVVDRAVDEFMAGWSGQARPRPRIGVVDAGRAAACRSASVTP